jgi:hypothetical protein
MFEQQGGDATVVHVIDYRERDLRRTALAARYSLTGGDVAGAADHLAVRQREQRHLIRRRVTADPPRLGVGRQPVELAAWCSLRSHLSSGQKPGPAMLASASG